MDNIYLAVVFMAPGLLIRRIRKFMKRIPTGKKNPYEDLFDIVLDSVIVGVVTAYIMILIKNQKIYSLPELFLYLKSLSWLIPFVLIETAVSFLWYYIKFKAVVPAAREFRNMVLLETEFREHDEETVWNILQKEEDIIGTWQVVSLFKDNTYIMSGMIAYSSGGGSEEFELTLEHVRKVEELKQKRPELFEDYFDYYNASTGLRIKFYKQKKIMEHWDEYFEGKEIIS